MSIKRLLVTRSRQQKGKIRVVTQRARFSLLASGRERNFSVRHPPKNKFPCQPASQQRVVALCLIHAIRFSCSGFLSQCPPPLFRTGECVCVCEWACGARLLPGPPRQGGGPQGWPPYKKQVATWSAFILRLSLHCKSNTHSVSTKNEDVPELALNERPLGGRRLRLPGRRRRRPRDLLPVEAGHQGLRWLRSQRRTFLPN